MKKALISPLEAVEAGFRIAEVANETFDVAPPLFWIDCNDDVLAETFWYDPESEAAKPITLPEYGEAHQPTVDGAETL